MASAKIAEHVVSKAIERISELLNHETASVAARVREDLEELRAELMQILKSLVSRFSVRRVGGDEENEQIRIWLKTVIDVAYEVSDVVETCIVKLDSSSCAGALRICVGGVGARIKSIRSRIKEIMVQVGGEEDGMGTSAAEVEGPGRRIQNPDGGDYLDEQDDFVVGLERSVAVLKAELMEETDGRRGVSIVGMGGVGKTTLAKHVCGLREVRQHFDCYAWVYVSATAEVRQILYEILVQVGFRGHYKRKGIGTSDGFKEDLKYGNFVELTRFVRDELEEKRYLVVLDDVWEADTWEELQHAFPPGKRGSKVMLTTRVKSVAIAVDRQGFPFETQLLTPMDSFELLARKAFGHHQSCPPQLTELLEDIVFRYCRGLPLSIILLGGLLRTKSSLDGWEQVWRYLSEDLVTVEDFGWMYKIISLCYNDLPCHLTPCLLYFGAFPEGWEVPKQELIRYWIAEGFIPKPRREGEAMESIAEGYLGELINRGMVQVVKRDHTGVGVKTCQMHDLVREFCIMVAHRSNFFNTVTLGRAGDTDLFRRIVVHDESDFGRIPLPHHSMRSLLRFTTNNHLHISILWSGVLRKFRLLRVLELGFITGSCDDHQPTKFPEEIGELVYLKYLGLRGVFIFTLPSSIGNLRYLHTLDLRRVGITKLPRSIGKLQSLYTLDVRGNKLQSLPKTMSRLTCLRHLLLPALQSYMPSSLNSVRSCFRMDKLKNLQTLKLVQARTLIRCDAVLRLTNIRNLKIEFICSQEVRAVLASPIVELNRLRSLHLSLLSQDTFPSLESLSRCYNLRKLGLHGTLSEEGLHFLPNNLNKLLLSKSNMMQDPMTVLQKMTNLRFLRLGKNSYNGSEMACLADGFPKLETLQLVGLSELREWRVESGSMLSLKTLDIENTRKLTMLPEELKCLPSLRDLNITDVRETSGDEPTAEDSARGENLAPVRRLQPTPSFLLNVGNMPPTISVHLIVAEISSAVGY